MPGTDMVEEGRRSIADDAELPIHRVSLKQITNSPRFRRMDRSESYFRGTQDEHKKHDWDGMISGIDGSEFDIEPGWYVPIKRRKPSVRYNLAKSIVKRFTGMLFGDGRFPQFQVEDDPDAEHAIREIAKVSKLRVRMQEARNLGGACGTVALSFAFVEGTPRVRVHNAKNCTVLRWADAHDLRPAAVVEAYPYKRTEVDDEGKTRSVDYYYVRYWDEHREAVWEAVPAKIAKEQSWTTLVRSREVMHNFGFCPVYWIQNLPDSSDVDGDPDFDREDPNFDALNQIASARHKGTIANIDPTLVIKSDPIHNKGTVKKGSGHAIYSTNGAEYLEMSGKSLEAAGKTFDDTRDAILEDCECVLPDPDQVAASKSISGESLRLVYAPMLNKCSLYREQYGEAMVVMLLDMLEVARRIESSKMDMEVDPFDGSITYYKIELRITRRRRRMIYGEDGSPEFIEPEIPSLDLGTSSNLTLSWPPYFPHTWDDMSKAARAVREASNGKQVISHETAVKIIAPMTGVVDVDVELEKIEADAEAALDRAQKSFGAGGPFPAPADEPVDDGGDEDDDEDDDTEE